MTFTLGYTTTPTSSAYKTGLNYQNQMAVEVTAPSSGATIQSVSGYFGGSNSTVTASMCVWDTGGNLVAWSPWFTAPGYGLSAGGQGWQTGNIISSTVNIPSNGSVWIGWWRTPGGSMVWSENNGGNVEWLSTNTSGNPGSLGANYAGSGVPGIYCTCATIGGIDVYTGSGWQKSPAYVWQATSWTKNPVYTWNGSSWIRNG